MKNLVISLIIVLNTSCVSPKIYKNLEEKYIHLKTENRVLKSENELLLKTKNEAKNELKRLKKDYEESHSSYNGLRSDLAATQNKYNNLKASYDALETNSSSSIAKNTKKNRELLAQLEAKELALAAENIRLEQMRKTLESRSKRVAELEQVISVKDQAMRALKDAISNALTDFEGKGLTIVQREGKVYVSMENKLLFKSGSWSVGEQGKKAVQKLANVLGNNPEIAVLIEGHTDNAPFSGNGPIKNNWDLSTKRATAIVAILLQNNLVKAANLTAAGRSEYLPIASNHSSEGKAKNRRIEVILTPKLDAISKLLNEI